MTDADRKRYKYGILNTTVAKNKDFLQSRRIQSYFRRGGNIWERFSFVGIFSKYY